jgi:hypothetical protein
VSVWFCVRLRTHAPRSLLDDESDCNAMDFTPDPNDRCRIDREAMIERDDVWRRRQRGESFRHIGRALNMPATSVQRCYQRALKRRQLSPIERELDAELDAALAKYDDDGPRAEEVSRAEQVGRCNALERYRLRHFDPDSPQRRALAQWAKSHPARSKAARRVEKSEIMIDAPEVDYVARQLKGLDSR